MSVRAPRSNAVKTSKPDAPANGAEAAKPMPTDAETLEFLKAIDAFKRKTARNFPSWTEALELLYDLGWRKSVPARKD